MKQKYGALKMYLIGMTVGLFSWGCAAVAHLDAAQANPAGQALASSTTLQSQSASVQSFSTQPRIRTRTS